MNSNVKLKLFNLFSIVVNQMFIGCRSLREKPFLCTKVLNSLRETWGYGGLPTEECLEILSLEH